MTLGCPGDLMSLSGEGHVVPYQMHFVVWTRAELEISGADENRSGLGSIWGFGAPLGAPA